MKKNILFFVVFLVVCTSNGQTKDEVRGMIERVNSHWQATRTARCRGFWDNAAYFTGNQAVYELTGKQEYLDYALEWAEYNHWKGATQTDKSKWEYATYGEDMNHVLFADWQICFQVYIDLYKLEHRAERLERTLEVMMFQAKSDKADYWWWSDALYMGLPIFTKLYTVTHNERLLDKQYECFKWTDDLLWDKDQHLYYRDGKYVWPKVKTACDGGKSFWARGDGCWPDWQRCCRTCLKTRNTDPSTCSDSSNWPKQSLTANRTKAIGHDRCCVKQTHQVTRPAERHSLHSECCGE